MSHQVAAAEAETGQHLSRDWRDWVGLVARLILGISLFYAGAIKVGNLDRNVYQVELYQLPLPGWFETLVGYSQPFVEIAVGLMLVVGLFTRVNGLLGALAMVVFIAGISWAWAKGLRIDCGCFSPGGELAPDEKTRYGEDIARDIGLMACGIWLAVRPSSVLAVDNWLFRPVNQATITADQLVDEQFAQPDDQLATSSTGEVIDTQAALNR